MISTIMAAFVYFAEKVQRDFDRDDQPDKCNEHLWHRLTSFAVK